MDLPTPSASTSRQARALRQLASFNAAALLMELISQYFETVGINNVLSQRPSWYLDTYKEAMVSPQADERQAAMHKELNSLDKVADLVPASSIPPSNTIIGSRWIYRVKADGRLKARLVVQGWAQRHRFDCFSTFTPVCKSKSQRPLLAIATSKNWPVAAMDMEVKFHNGSAGGERFRAISVGISRKESHTIVGILNFSRIAEAGRLVLLLSLHRFTWHQSSAFRASPWNGRLSHHLQAIQRLQSTRLRRGPLRVWRSGEIEIKHRNHFCLYGGLVHFSSALQNIAAHTTAEILVMSACAKARRLPFRNPRSAGLEVLRDFPLLAGQKRQQLQHVARQPRGDEFERQ